MEKSSTFELSDIFIKMIRRSLEIKIKEKIGSNKAIIILGSRQTGKTTLLKSMFSKLNKPLWIDAEEARSQSLFRERSVQRFSSVFAPYNTIVIDEAQAISDIGIKLKLIIDNLPGKQIIATGSSAFELANKVNEPLTGRKWEYYLFPLSFQEMVNENGLWAEKANLDKRLIFGMYPEVVTSVGREKEILQQLANSFLYKDILMWENIKKPEKIIQLLQALALQIGQQVSFNELSQLLNLKSETVEKYIRLLEQTFVIFRLGSFKRNIRNELKKSKKIYFYDNGIRNALIANFSMPDVRQDIGALWENFMISERIKYNHYNNVWANSWFWRTKSQQEIDYLEEMDGKLYAFEFKWNAKKKVNPPLSFQKAYPEFEFQVVNPENFEEFIYRP